MSLSRHLALRQRSFQSRWGFTLVELLIVIAIIGILMVLGFANLTGAQRRSRDAKRRSDMKIMQNGEEQYYFDSGLNSYGDPNVILPQYIVGGTLPVDPTTGQPYFMSVALRGFGVEPKYCICAKLEVPGTGNASAPTEGVPSCSYTGPKDYFCVQNLQ